MASSLKKDQFIDKVEYLLKCMSEMLSDLGKFPTIDEIRKIFQELYHENTKTQDLFLDGVLTMFMVKWANIARTSTAVRTHLSTYTIRSGIPCGSQLRPSSDKSMAKHLKASSISQIALHESLKLVTTLMDDVVAELKSKKRSVKKNAKAIASLRKIMLKELDDPHLLPSRKSGDDCDRIGNFIENALSRDPDITGVVDLKWTTEYSDKVVGGTINTVYTALRIREGFDVARKYLLGALFYEGGKGIKERERGCLFSGLSKCKVKSLTTNMTPKQVKSFAKLSSQFKGHHKEFQSSIRDWNKNNALKIRNVDALFNFTT